MCYQRARLQHALKHHLQASTCFGMLQLPPVWRPRGFYAASPALELQLTTAVCSALLCRLAHLLDSLQLPATLGLCLPHAAAAFPASELTTHHCCGSHPALQAGACFEPIATATDVDSHAVALPAPELTTHHSCSSRPALQAGACFGLSAAASRTGFMLASRGTALWTPAGILCSVALSAAGVLTQTRGLKDGNSVVVCTCAAVSSMASGRVLIRAVVKAGCRPGRAAVRHSALLDGLLSEGVQSWMGWAYCRHRIALH